MEIWRRLYSSIIVVCATSDAQVSNELINTGLNITTKQSVLETIILTKKQKNIGIKKKIE